MLVKAQAPLLSTFPFDFLTASWKPSLISGNVNIPCCWVPAVRWTRDGGCRSRHNNATRRGQRRGLTEVSSPPRMALMGDVAFSGPGRTGDSGDVSRDTSQNGLSWQPPWSIFEAERRQTEDLLAEAVGYDVDAMDRFFVERPERAWMRCAQVGVEVFGVLLALAVDQIALAAGGRENGVRGRAPEYIRQAVTRLGPNFVKIGQALASRPDLVGEATAGELLMLQDAMPIFPNDVAREFVREELGGYPEEIFERMEDNPVAAASLGQVYKAWVAGRPVAVKVQRPDLLEAVALDFYLARAMADAITQLSRGSDFFGGRLAVRSDLVAAVDEYGSRLFEELDYRIEANNMVLFEELYGNMPDVVVPDVLLEYSGRRVITTEWIDGEKLVDAQAQVCPSDMPILRVGIECTLTQLLDKGFLHADPHGGNLLKTPDKRLAYLDFGLVSTIPPTVMDALICATVQVMNRDYVSLAKGFPDLALMSEDDLVQDFAPFAVALEDALDPIVANFRRQLGLDGGDGDDMRRIAFAQLIDRIFLLARSFNFKVPPYFISNVRALGELEGLAMTADPGFSLITVVYPYVCRRLLSDPSPSLRTALQDLAVAEDGSMRWDMLEALVKDANMLDQRYGPDVTRPPLDLSLEFLLSTEGKFFRDAAASDLKRAAFSSLSRKIPSFDRFRKANSPSPKRGNAFRFDGISSSRSRHGVDIDDGDSEDILTDDIESGLGLTSISSTREVLMGSSTPPQTDIGAGSRDETNRQANEQAQAMVVEAADREASRRELSRRLFLGARRRPALALRVGAVMAAAAVLAVGKAIIRGFRGVFSRPFRRRTV